MITINKMELEAAARMVEYAHSLPRTGKTERETLVNCVKQASHADAVTGTLSALGLEWRRNSTTDCGYEVFAPVYRKCNQGIIRILLEGYKTRLETEICEQQYYIDKGSNVGLTDEAFTHRIELAKSIIKSGNKIIAIINGVLESEA